MNDDELIRRAVQRAEGDVVSALEDEPPFTETIIQSFRGKRRWLTIFPIFLSLLYTVLMFGCGYQFFQSETTRSLVGWATGFLVCAISIGLVKIWVWIEWQRNTLAREIKRLELTVIDLRGRLDP